MQTAAANSSVFHVMAGQHNAFPRRIPSAASDKLRQMYLKTDTISGRLAFNSAHERNKQRRWNVLQHTIEEQERELEQRNRDTATNMERLQQKSAPPNVSSTLLRLDKVWIIRIERNCHGYSFFLDYCSILMAEWYITRQLWWWIIALVWLHSATFLVCFRRAVGCWYCCFH